jgi:hypothetical protein
MNPSKANTANFWKYWPEKKTLTLKPKSFTSTTADQFGSDVACSTCRKREPTRDEKLNANIFATQELCVWEIWDRGQASPRAGDTLVDDTGAEWIVSSVESLVFGNLFSCLAINGL